MKSKFHFLPDAGMPGYVAKLVIAGAIALAAVLAVSPGAAHAAATTTGSLTICTMFADDDGNVATTSATVPAGSFSIPMSYQATNTDPTRTTLSPFDFTSAGFAPNTMLISSTTPDAHCFTSMTELPFGWYVYGEETVNGTTTASTTGWTVKYNDQFRTTVTSLSDFFEYDSESNVDSDGAIDLGTTTPSRTLVVLNVYDASTTPVAATSSDSTSGGGSSSGSSSGGSSGGSSSGGLSGHRNDISGIGSASSSSGSGSGQACEYLTTYLKREWTNDPMQVKLLQIFLKNLEGSSAVDVNGVFDDATFEAVEAFQMKYASDILVPWGYRPDEPTGFVYILTRKKVNEIVCARAFGLTTAQEEEIASFKAFMDGLRNEGYVGMPNYEYEEESGPETPGTGTTGTPTTPGASTTTGAGGQVIDETEGGNGTTTGTSTRALSKGKLGNLAAAVFTLPATGTEKTRCIFNILIILAIIYIITSILVPNDEVGGMTRDRIRVRKLMFFLAGTLIAIAFALFFDMYCLVAPLLAVLVVLLILLVVRKMGGPKAPSTGSTVVTPAPSSAPAAAKPAAAEPKVEAPKAQEPEKPAQQASGTGEAK